MNLSRREKLLVFATLGVLVFLLGDYYALTPLLERQDVLQAQREQVLAELGRAQKLMAERKQLTPRWNSLLSSGMKSEPSEAEGQLLHALRDWARETGFALSSLKPERPESKEQLKEVNIQATGTGTLDGIAKFLWKMHSAAFPLKVLEFQLVSRNDGMDDLSLQVKISTLYNALEKKAAKADKPGGGGAR
ncbi:MAG: type 4a pilus biogenesis protein PilO [Planctomycetota bacterium]